MQKTFAEAAKKIGLEETVATSLAEVLSDEGWQLTKKPPEPVVDTSADISNEPEKVAKGQQLRTGEKKL